LLAERSRLSNVSKQRAQDFRHALAGHGGDDEWPPLSRSLEARHLLLQSFRGERIGLVERDDLRFLGEPMTIGGKLSAHGIVRFARMLTSSVDQMKQDAATLEMPEKAVA
jgi:hypothetical protein